VKTRNKIVLGAVGYLVFVILIGVIFGSAGKNEEFQPQNEFKLDNWIPIHLGGIDLSINKAVLYLFITCALTGGVMVYVAKRMADPPNKVQTAIEWGYDFVNTYITRANMGEPMASKWFPFVATLFFFILISNLLGYIPLPTNSGEPVDLFGVSIPGFAIYAATANISTPLVLTLMVWFIYHIEGVRTHGVFGYLKSFIPAGVTGAAAVPIFVIEVISHFVRIISLSVRLFANLLAGHLLILFMAGGLAVILGIAALGFVTVPIAIVFFLFEVGLIAGLQAFIFATLTAIYIGGATAESH
jgi:F-type H+-transporting ATPase subunit a